MRAAPDRGNVITITDHEFHQFRDLIHTHTGIALSDHKRALVCSRLAKRLRHHGLARFTDYYTLLTQRDPQGSELLEMINCITTNKTEFFRERDHFKFLSEQVFPALIRSTSDYRSRKVRIWSAGSSSGEEAYSLAMAALEAFPPMQGWDIKILATDIDTNMLQLGEQGRYTEEQAQGIPRALLTKYFFKGTETNAGYVMVKPSLKEVIRFRRLNLLEEPWPFRGPFDVILCRNVIIYFDQPTQKKLIARMTQVVRRNGYLLLGHSESLHTVNTGYRHAGHSIYHYEG